MNRKISDRRMARLMELKRRANRAIRAEEEAEIEDAEVVDESAEEQEVSEQEVPEQESEEQEVSEKITLDDGSEIDGNVDLSELDGSELVRIVRADGIVLYMQAQNEEEAKEIYEAICDATMKEDYESKEQEESEEEPEEELSEAEEVSEEVLSDIPEDADAVAVEVKEASMKAPSKLYYVIRSRRGTRAYRASRILPRIMAGRVARKAIRPMAALRMAIKASKRKMSLRPSRRVARRMTRRMPMRMASCPVRSPMARQTRLEKARRMAMRRKMAERLPNRAERRAASRASGRMAGRIARRPMTRRHAATTEIEDALKVRDTKTPPNKWDLDYSEVKKNDYDSEIAFEKKDFDKADDSGKVKAAPSDVRSYYGKLPSKAETGTDVIIGMKDFNQIRNKNASVLKAVAQNLKTARTQLKAKDAELAKKDSEIKDLKARLQKIADKENLKKRSALIDGLIAAMHCEDEEEIVAMRSKFASYSDEQLNAVHETLTKSAAEAVTEHEEDVLMSNIRKEAGELSGFTPSMTLKDEPMNSFDAIEKEILEKEQNSLN